MPNITLFDELLTETCKILATTPDQLVISDGCKKCWCDLANVWKDNHHHFGNVFYRVLYHVKWGRYAKNAVNDNLNLYDALVENVLLYDADAFEAWKRMACFRTDFRTIQTKNKCRDTYQCVLFDRFLYNRFMVLTYYRDPSCVKVDLSTIRREDLRRMQSVADVRNEYHRYMDAVCMLLPEAKEWEKEQWLDEAQLLNAISAAYALHFPQDIEKFEKLLDLAMHMAGNRSYFKKLFLIEDIPEAMVGALWPQNPEKEISRQFHYLLSSKRGFEQAGGHSWRRPEYHDDAKVQKSWAFRALLDWQPKLSKTTQKRLMEYCLNIAA